MKSTFKSYSWLVISGAMLVGVSTQAAPVEGTVQSLKKAFCRSEAECKSMAEQAQQSLKNFCKSAAECVGLKFVEEAPKPKSVGEAAFGGASSSHVDAPAMPSKAGPAVEAKPVASVPSAIPGSKLEGALAPSTKFVKELSPGAKVYKVKPTPGTMKTPAEELLAGMVADLERAKKLAKETGEPIPGFDVYVVKKGDIPSSKKANNLDGKALVDDTGVAFDDEGLMALNESLSTDKKTGRKLSSTEVKERINTVRKDLCASCGYCPTGKDVSGRILPAAGH